MVARTVSAARPTGPVAPLLDAGARSSCLSHMTSSFERAPGCSRRRDQRLHLAGGEYERASSRAVLVPHEVGLTKNGRARLDRLARSAVRSGCHVRSLARRVRAQHDVDRAHLAEVAAQLLGDVDLVAVDPVVALVALVAIGALLVGLVQLAGSGAVRIVTVFGNGPGGMPGTTSVPRRAGSSPASAG